MTRGATRAGSQPEQSGGRGDIASPAIEGFFPAVAEPDGIEAAPYSVGARILGFMLLALALTWLGLFGWVIAPEARTASIQQAVVWAAVASVPLILIGMIWLAFGRTRRSEAERFTRAVLAMRRESRALDDVLAIVATRLQENQQRVTAEAARLMALGDETCDRLGRVAHYLAQESAALDTKGAALEAAAAAARVDIGVLLHDLPRAEQQARGVADAMKGAGLAAHEQAGALEGQLAALAARGREADEIVGGAAQRLGAHVARIESTAAASADRMSVAAESMSGAVDATMARAADAVDAARSGLEAQGAATLAMIEQSRAALDRAGEDAERNLAARLDALSTRIDAFGATLSAQDEAARALAERMTRDLGEVDEQFAELGRTASSNAQQLADELERLRGDLGQLVAELDGGHERASYLIDRAADMSAALSGVAGQLDALPPALSRIEDQALRAGETARAVVPVVETAAAHADAASSLLSEAEGSAVRQRETVEAVFGRLEAGLAGTQEQLRMLLATINEADDAAARIVGAAAPELVDALVRVRETAQQAVFHAREALAAVIPDSAAALGEATVEALTQAIEGPVQDAMAELEARSGQASEAARAASERLTRQLVAIGESAAAIEAHIERAEADRVQRDQEGLSRTMSLLVESLNSTAIDVTKILSNDVTDSAWAAYLKGDRGVFTRRAVRLLDGNEARDIAQHYENEPEFRDQVNRYVHDFEAMLRRVLADRDGSPIAVTLLSSDIGKLYVALAQAIERLRT